MDFPLLPRPVCSDPGRPAGIRVAVALIEYNAAARGKGRVAEPAIPDQCEVRRRAVFTHKKAPDDAGAFQ